MKFTLVNIDGVDTVVTVVHNGEVYQAVVDHHPSFTDIVDRLLDDPEDESVLDLFDVGRAVEAKFSRLSDRVTVRGGEVLFDGDPISNTFTNQIVRFVNEGVDDWKPLVLFLENVYSNPLPNAREQIVVWVENGDFTITEDGLLVGYKGVTLGADGVGYSTRSAPAKDGVTVDGEPIVDKPVPNVPGTVVEMPRSAVDTNPNRHCSTGLHIGTFRYAQSFTGYVLEVHVNPRDFVSVTADSSREKIRACRYKVVGVVKDRYSTPVLPGVKAVREAKVAKATKVDTRDNHLEQKRDASGRFVRKV